MSIADPQAGLAKATLCPHVAAAGADSYRDALRNITVRVPAKFWQWPERGRMCRVMSGEALWNAGSA